MAQAQPASLAYPSGAGGMPLSATLHPPEMAQQPATGFTTHGIDPQTLHLLEQVRHIRQAGPQGYTDRHLAGDLTAAALGHIVPGWDPQHAQAYVQRAGAVGQMFNSILADHSLPADLKPQFDQLRFSVIKSTLQDASFFANPAHPVRGLVNELATLAANARATSLDTLKRIEELVGQIQTQFNVAADTVRKPREASPEPPNVAAFLEQQLEQNKSRRQSLIEQVRRVIAEELQLRTAGRKLPDAAIKLLHSGWAPMAARSLLQEGIGGAGWRNSLTRLDEILSALNPEPGHSRAPEQRLALLLALEEDFRTAGFAAPRSRELLEGLRGAIEELDDLRVQQEAEAAKAAAAAAPLAPLENRFEPPAGRVSPMPSDRSDEAPTLAPPDAAQLLELLIVPGAWFRIQDNQHKAQRWLKAVAYHPDRDCVAFAEFDGRNSVLLTKAAFLEELLAGRITPLDLSRLAQRSLRDYLAGLNPGS